MDSARLLSTLLDPHAVSGQLQEIEQVLNDAMRDVTRAYSYLYIVTQDLNEDQLTDEGLDSIMQRITDHVSTKYLQRCLSTFSFRASRVHMNCSFRSS